MTKNDAVIIGVVDNEEGTINIGIHVVAMLPRVQRKVQPLLYYVELMPETAV